MQRNHRVAIAVVATATLCGSYAIAGATAPPDDATTTLRLAAVPGWESRVEPVLEPAADEINIEIDWEWQDAHAASDIEQQIVTSVAAGDLDFGFVGTRAFAGLGVHSFDALTAPFLVDSYPLQEAVLGSDIPERMMAGLEELGVTGLTVIGGALRRPLAMGAPLLSPDDFAGITFHTFRSVHHAATAEALGATHTDVWGDERNTGLEDGSIAATENSLEWAFTNGRASSITLNAPLWPATAVLIANPDSLAGLTSDQLAAIDQAAGEHFSTAAELADADTELIGQLCDAGKQFANASDDDIAALRAAVQPVYDLLVDDAETAGYLSEIEELAGSATADAFTIPDDCGGDAASATAEGFGDQSVLNGTYSLEWTADELLEALIDAGAPDDALLERDARNNAGRFTLTLEDGTFDQAYESDPGANCPGTYALSGDRITMVASSDIAEWDCGGDSLGAVLLDAAWQLNNGQLILSDFVLSDEPDVTWWNAVYFSKPLTGATIPIGLYTRTITVADAEAVGADPAFIAAEIGTDGVLDITVEFFADGEYLQQADYAGNGVFAYGDGGTYEYDDDGRVVGTSTSTGCRGCVAVLDWSFADGVLTIELLPSDDQSRPPDPIEQLMVSGNYQLAD